MDRAAILQVFGSFPQVVAAHFSSKSTDIIKKLEGTPLALKFYSDAERRGPGMVRVVLHSATFENFTSEQRLTGELDLAILWQNALFS